MEQSTDITDPTDWAETPVAELQAVESALRCQICKEFFDTPVITSCAHTFCSICIRRCLSHDGNCPVCRKSDQPIRLRRNWVVEDLVSAFTKARPSILNLGLRASEGNNSEMVNTLKRKFEVALVNSETISTRRKTRSQGQTVHEHITPQIHDSQREDKIPDGGSDSAFAIEETGAVECPICQMRMREIEVSPHIDRVHLESTATAKNQTTMFGSKLDIQKTDLNAQTHDRLSQLNYSLLSESALRKKLGALGIPASGNKQLMIRRHKEWVDLHNANCDSAKPRKKRNLLRELDVWERTQGNLARNDDVNGIMSKDFDGASWARKNNMEFNGLIAKAQAKTKASAVQTKPTESNDRSDDVCKTDISMQESFDSLPER